MGRHGTGATPDRGPAGRPGGAGYTTEQAIAELVGNSVDARVDGEREEVAVELDFEGRRITVRDDGAGMGRAGLRRAWARGAPGTGMRGACASLGRAFSVRTTVAGSAVELTATHGRAPRRNGRGGLEVGESRADAAAHGTTVSVSGITVPLYRGQASRIRDSLGRRYAHHMFDGKARITVNGRLCVPTEPHIDTATREALDIALAGGNRVRGWAALFRRHPAGQDYGFSLYRNGRLVSSHSKLAGAARARMPRIAGELHLDHVPVNATKTAFLEGSAEYREAARAVMRSPAVRRLARASEGSVRAESDHALALDGARLAARLPRLGDRAAGLLLDKLSGSGPVGSGSMPVVIEDADSGVYRVVGSGSGAVVAVNRNSALFRAFRNPVYLLGMLRVEARALSAHPDARRLLSGRNAEWERLVSGLSLGRPAPARARARDTLPGNLAPLRALIESRFRDRFQFTALSVLWPFLNNMYRVMTYTVYTVRGSGRPLAGIISGHDGCRTLLNPDSGQVRATHSALDGGTLVVVRERSGVPKSTAAAYSKAWVDLYAEAKRKCAGVYARELEMFWDLDDLGLVSEGEVMRFAKMCKLGAEIRGYLEGRA